MVKNTNIIIIGAGASGIAAATKLYENGFTNLTILEAENRIGGRINSVEFGGSFIDLGGTWVHGEEGNMVYEMVKDLDLLSVSPPMFENMTFYLPDGSIINKELSDKLCNIVEEILSNEEDARICGGSFGDYFVNKYNAMVLKRFDKTNELEAATQILEWYKKFQLMRTEKSWTDFTVQQAFILKSCPGNQFLSWRNKGYKTILDILMKNIPDPSQRIPIEERILLNKEVNAINWNDDSSDRVTVKCVDGSSYVADHLIITVSLGVLKENHKIWFTPELPDSKINSIEHLSMGTVNKIILKFPQKWWPNDVHSFSLVSTEAEKFKNNVYGSEPKLNGLSWTEYLLGFYTLDSHPNVLLVWVLGDLAIEIENFSDEVVIRNCIFILRKFLGKKYKVLEADAILRSQWKSNPHFCGSYTFTTSKAVENNVSAEDLAQPVLSRNGRNVLQFAGESTHSKYITTVHGAIETGYREAERLIKLYQ